MLESHVIEHVGLVLQWNVIISFIVHVLYQKLDAAVRGFTIMIKEQRVLSAESFAVNFLSTVPTSLNGVKVGWFIDLTVLWYPLGMVCHSWDWHQHWHLVA